jgi:hypothetical protein
MLSLQDFLQMKHFLECLTPHSTKLKLTLNPEGAKGAFPPLLYTSIFFIPAELKKRGKN